MPAHINYKPKIRKIIETVLYLAHNVSGLTDYKCAKLIYLADKKHLNKYHRPITYDHFYAEERGPVPSVASGLIKGDKATLIKYDADINARPFNVTETATGYDISEPDREFNREVFSKSDIKVLDEIIAEFADKSDDFLHNLTHSHAAYINAWSRKNGNGDKKILVEDMMDEIEPSIDREDLIETMRYTAPAIF